MGLYRLRDGALTAVAAAGPLNPKELTDVRATETLLKPAIAATQAGMSWIRRDGLPEVRRTRPGRAAADSGWIGMRANEAYAVRSTRQTPLFHPAIALLLILGGLMLGWRREGR
jgi:putative N-acetylmannosamine-6-phosphate epimerase